MMNDEHLRFGWWDEDGWKVAMIFEHIVKVRLVEGSSPPTFEIKRPGGASFRHVVTPAPGQTPMESLEGGLVELVVGGPSSP